MGNPAFWGGLVFTLFALYMLKHAVQSFRAQAPSQAWPRAPGRITKSEVVRFEATGGHYSPVVEYVYRVGGEHFEGNRVALYTIATKADAEQVVGRFPVGAEVPVYYQPENPENAALIPGRSEDKPYSDLILATFGVALGLFITIAGFLGIIG